MAANGLDVDGGLRRPMAALVRPETITLLHEDGGVVPNQQAVLPNQQPVLPNQQPVLPNQQAVLPNEQAVLPNEQAVLPNEQAELNLHLPAAAPDVQDQAVNAAGVHPGEALHPGVQDEAVNAAAAAAEEHPVEALRRGAHDQAAVAEVRAVEAAVVAAEVRLVEALRPGAHDQVVNAVAAEVRPVEVLVHDQAVNAAAVAEVRPMEALRPGAHGQAVNAEVRPGEAENANLQPQEVIDQLRNGPPIDDNEYVTEVEDSCIPASSSRGTKRLRSGELVVNKSPDQLVPPPLEERFTAEMLGTTEPTQSALSCSPPAPSTIDGERVVDESPAQLASPPLEERYKGKVLENNTKQFVASFSPLPSTSSDGNAVKITSPTLEAFFVSAESSTKNKQRAEQAHPDQ